MSPESDRLRPDVSSAGSRKSGVGARELGSVLGFVVQTHAASRLHYDFRLELDGALKSWAMPRGPSLDPSVRRLAMHVEDHPLEYGSFEGVIPEDEYGAGTVLLWDRGTWQPEGDPRAAYSEGRLRFELTGEKLRGGWVLMRVADRDAAGKESWLLVKESDDASRAGGGSDIVAERPESVATGRGLAEIAAARDRVWSSNRPARRSARRRAASITRVSAARAARPRPGGRKGQPPLEGLPGAREGTLPATPRAQLATLVSQVPPGDDWLHEIKLDGYRLLCRLSRGKTRLITRNGKDWTDRFPGIAAAVQTLLCDDALIDGEAVVLDERGVSRFQRLQNAIGRGGSHGILYYAFDLPHIDGYDLTHVALRDRKHALQGLIAPLPSDSVLRYSDHVEGQGRAFFDQACRLGLEGIISKRADAHYQPGRGRAWLKIKCVLRQEFVIAGFTDPSGARTAFGALILAVNQRDGRLAYAGRVGTGFDERALRTLHARLVKIERDEPAILDPPRGAAARGIHWVEPVLVAEVAFTEWTTDGRIRHPSFQGLREDKPPAEVVRERPARD